MKKYKKISAFIFAALFLLSYGVVAVALEVELPGLDKNAKLPEYVKYIFTMIVGAAGLVAAISFAVGAVGLILAGITANSEAAKSAKDRMIGAIIGLVLVGASTVILTTINPQFKTLTLAPLPSLSPLPSLPPIPGVYYYTEPGCNGGSSPPHTYSDLQISKDFAGKIQSIKIINDPTSDAKFTVIFHQQPISRYLVGYCTPPITGDGCQPVNNPNFTNSANIFEARQRSGSAEDGIIFYSEPFGSSEGQSTRGGSYYLKDNDIIPMFKKDADKMEYDWPETAEHKNRYKTFQDRPGSIIMKGNYLVSLYSKDPQYMEAPDMNMLFCQTFPLSVNDLNAVSIVAGGNSVIEYVQIWGTIN